MNSLPSGVVLADSIHVFQRKLYQTDLLLLAICRPSGCTVASGVVVVVVGVVGVCTL